MEMERKAPLTRIQGFEPVVDRESRVLILGSMPSVKSLEAHFYYAHPRNAFWPILADLFHVQRPKNVQEKIALALQNRVALWDVLRACDRKGSEDASIRRVQINDFCAFFETYPSIHTIFLNGKTAHRLFVRSCMEAAGARQIKLLPSTSPAHAVSYEKKLAAWEAVKEALDKN